MFSDDELLAAAYLSDTDTLDQLLGVARLCRTQERFRDTLTTLLFSAANTGKVPTFDILCKYGACLRYNELIHISQYCSEWDHRIFQPLKWFKTYAYNIELH